MIRRSVDIAIVGSGAGGGTVAQQLAPLCTSGARIAVFEKGPKLRPEDFTGKELEMSQALYQDGGGFLTAERTMTLAFGSVYGGSTVVYTGTSLPPPERILRRWDVPGITLADLEPRVRKFMADNNVHLLDDPEINQNNRLFADGCRRLRYDVKRFPVNVRGCRGSSLCNLGCPNLAKQGTHRVQLPSAESHGVEVVTRSEVLRVGERSLSVRVAAKPPGGKGEPSPWEPGDYEIAARVVVVAGGAVNSPALLMRSGFARRLPQLGRRFTCHPAFIMVAEHAQPITNFVGHPKSFYLDQFAESDRFVLETCMYFPLVTAKAMAGFGQEHSRFMQAFPRLQMILVMACDRATPHNRVSADAQGRPVVHYRFTPEVMRALLRGAATSARIFFAAGARRVHLPVGRAITPDDAAGLDSLAEDEDFKTGKVPVAAAHLQGGCSMGRTADDSVTDGFGRVHGIPWLYVADSSLFPDALEINPYLTIMALADRVAQHIRENVTHLL